MCPLMYMYILYSHARFSLVILLDNACLNGKYCYVVHVVGGGACGTVDGVVAAAVLRGG